MPDTDQEAAKNIVLPTAYGPDGTAWTRCLHWALRSDEVRQAFQADTGHQTLDRHCMPVFALWFHRRIWCPLVEAYQSAETAPPPGVTLRAH